MLSDLRENVSDFLEATVFKGVTPGGQRDSKCLLEAP